MATEKTRNQLFYEKKITALKSGPPEALQAHRDSVRIRKQRSRDKKKLSPGAARRKKDCEKSKRHWEKKKRERDNLPPEKQEAIVAKSRADSCASSRRHRLKKKTSHNKQGPSKSVRFQIHEDKERTSTMNPFSYLFKPAPAQANHVPDSIYAMSNSEEKEILEERQHELEREHAEAAQDFDLDQKYGVSYYEAANEDLELHKKV